ncbi:aromatic-amino-acid transaminase [Formivibrio citricus]|uniref:Putative 8-amino-7-oxononanoate synthase n=1 Tax=Formivibrio citricus TaxID=83765 RepID=A0A1I4WVM3_9NEIS|nr:amino acid aminotransferase [Formivibrio citricus]SFN17515.1 aromatic-amino-acid transaminase [Formivibrio citricus]
MFSAVESYAGDPILSMVGQFAQDPRSGKVNLGIGLYYDEQGRIPQMRAVARAKAVLHEEQVPCTYLPMEGDEAYRRTVQRFLFAGQDGDHIATIQTLGGSGALKVGADFLKRYFPDSEVWVSDPTWENHVSIFEGAGFKVHRYPYFDPATHGVDFAGMLACFESLPAGSIVLLHPCCHNPTGCDPDRDQWAQLIELIVRRKLIPFVDMAYWGFGEGLDEDAYVVRTLAGRLKAGLICNSFSKIFSLYGERCGSLSVICSHSEEAERVLGQLKFTVRRNYSSPPSHGARIVSTVLQTPALCAEWQAELDEMRTRMQIMRKRLFSLLQSELPGEDFSYLLRQRGMFAYTGLSAGQVAELRETHAVYMLGSGRICVAGANENNVQQIASAIAAVV